MDSGHPGLRIHAYIAFNYASVYASVCLTGTVYVFFFKFLIETHSQHSCNMLIKFNFKIRVPFLYD